MALVAACQIATPSAPPTDPAQATPTTNVGSTAGPSTGGPAEGSPSPGPAESTRPTREGPTSADLINADWAAGILDEPTAILYRVYAMFGDSRLPAAYAMAEWDDDSPALGRAALQIESYPPEIANELRPFIARPTDPQSVFYSEASAGPAGLTPMLLDPFAAVALGNPFTPDDFECEPDGWGHVDGGTLLAGPAWKVWAGCNDPAAVAAAVEVAGYMDLLYTPEVTLMGPPKPDVGGGPNEAGDGALDVYLVNQCVARSGRCMGDAFEPADYGAIAYAQPDDPCTGTSGAEKCSGFIVFKRSFMGPNTPGSLAHELWHILEFNHNVGGVWIGNDWHWFVEASAKWAESHFYQPGRPANVYNFFRTYQSTRMGLTDTSGQNEYVSYTWPLFMEQAAGERAIATAWLLMEDEHGEQVLNEAINSQLSFHENFAEFAVRGWNEPITPQPDPVKTHLWDLDSGLPRVPPSGARLTRQQSLPAQQRGTQPLRIDEGMPRLSARYSDLVPEEEVQQVTVDFTNLTPESYYDIEALLWIEDTGWERRELEPGKTRFCFSEPADDVIEMIIVLGNHEYAEGHDVSGYWTVEALAEPCSGWDVTIKWTDVYDGVADTITFEGVVDELDTDYPFGEDVVYMKGTGTATGSRAGWAGCNPGIDHTPSGTVTATFQGIVLGDTIAVSAFADVFTELSGISTPPFEVDIEGGTAVYGNPPPSAGASPLSPAPTTYGELCPRYSYGTATVEPYEAPEP